MGQNVERQLAIRTGESIEIRYELAGLGSRFLAVGLDLAIQVAVTLALFALGAFVISLSPGSGVAGGSTGLAAATKISRAVLVGAGVFGVFLIFFGYFILFELWWSGRTPGKRALGIRVVRDAGFPLDIGGATVRNVVRIVEFGLGFYAVSALVAVLSKQNKRLGDLAAGTIVVRDRRYEAADLDAYLTRERPADDGLEDGQRLLVERYVARRDQLDPPARAAVAAHIAQRIRPQLRASFDFLDDDALLVHLGRGLPPER